MAQNKSVDIFMKDKEREHGFTVCEKPGCNECGLVKGPETVGNKWGVKVDVTCPSGYKPVSLFHTHPQGTTSPSPADIREARRLGLRSLCIGVPDTQAIDCYDITKSSVKKITRG